MESTSYLPLAASRVTACAPCGLKQSATDCLVATPTWLPPVLAPSPPGSDRWGGLGQPPGGSGTAPASPCSLQGRCAPGQWPLPPSCSPSSGLPLVRTLDDMGPLIQDCAQGTVNTAVSCCLRLLVLCSQSLLSRWARAPPPVTNPPPGRASGPENHESGSWACGVRPAPCRVCSGEARVNLY